MIKFLTAVALAATPGLTEANGIQCVTSEELAYLTQAAVPGILDGLVEKCSTTLPGDSFLLTRGAGLAERLRSETKIPPGKLVRAIKTISEAKVSDDISDATLEMMVNDIGKSEVIKDIKPESCGAINDLVEAIAPLPAANLMKLVQSILDFAGREDFNLCPKTPDA
jgi:hypothetical protein